MKNIKIPSRFKACLLFAFANAALFTLARIIFFFINRTDSLPASQIARAFITGLRFDLRIAFILALPLGIVFLFNISSIAKKITAFIYSLIFGAITLIYFVDFGYYAYLTERLNAYVFELAANTTTSAEMVWQSYPVITGSVALLVIMGLYFIFARRVIFAAYGTEGRKKDYWYVLPAFLIAAGFIHGKFSQYPLRWSDAYFTNNNFISALALNPLQNLADTYRFAQKGVTFDENKTREFYNEAADFLGVTDKDAKTLNFERHIPQSAKGVKKYNVIFILTESLSFDKTSFNNPDLDTTPYLKEFSKKGKLFTRCFSPAAGTAKGVFATVTALPDTSTVKTSSRNPLIVKQHTLIDDLQGYKKFYFIGGSTSWGNIRGLLQYNIKDINIFEEGTYKNVARNDVWGLSDLDMFRYAAKELGQTKEPFFAVLQTAGFHRPYTIPEDKGDFKLDNKDEAMLKHYGFSGNAEYNSMRFQDYAMGQFFELAQKEPFFKDTIFFIYGDHGLTVHESKNAPKAIVDLELTTNNIPLVIVGPDIAAGIDERPASQVDVTATMAGILGMAHRQTALGRNLLDDKITRGAFILASPAAPLKVGYIEDDFYYTLWPTKKGMFKYKTNDSTTDYCPQYPDKCEKMQKLAQGLYEASRYITFHHK